MLSFGAAIGPTAGVTCPSTTHPAPALDKYNGGSAIVALVNSDHLLWRGLAGGTANYTSVSEFLIPPPIGVVQD